MKPQKSLAELQQLGNRYVAEVLRPTIARLPSFVEFVTKYGGKNIEMSLGAPEGAGQMVVHLSFPTHKFMSKFIKLQGGFGTSGAAVH